MRLPHRMTAFTCTLNSSGRILMVRLTVAQGAAVLVRLATLRADGPTGGFYGEEGPVLW